jgi:hypothetical protein
VGEFLHPHEYAARFPNVARAFQVVRGKAPDGTRAAPFHGWYSRLEKAIQAKDVPTLLTVLAERPGELARRFDHALRMAGDKGAANAVANSFIEHVTALATPVLVTLRSHLPARFVKAAVRVYWPKGRFAKGVSGPDVRPVLSRSVVDPVLRAIDRELLQRFAGKPRFELGIVDEGLRTVIVPFNERTASPSAVSLPRGSSVPVPSGKLTRLFLHWCEPPTGGSRTDIDLSVALYDDAWRFVGVCSYYQLKLKGAAGDVIAQSAGDRQDAPWPDGATEFVDLHRAAALASGVRYAVMVVNNYYGMPFSRLARGFAGIMFRDDPDGWIFDPRTVEHRFALDGENGIFLPLVLDLRESVLHWLDVQAKGQFEMNNVETSKAAIAKICPELMTYFGSGVRASMFDLFLLHAAARCQRVVVRGSEQKLFVRRPNEDASAFHARLVSGAEDEIGSLRKEHGAPVLAALFRGDVDVPPKSTVYALFRDKVAPTLAASDLLS